MRFKISGILLLAAAAYLAILAIIGLQQPRNDAPIGEVQALIAIFLVLLVRVLQTEKHHRDWLKQASDLNEKKAAEQEMAIPPLQEIAMAPLEEEVLRRSPVLETE
jgi:hypothetical protein